MPMSLRKSSFGEPGADAMAHVPSGSVGAEAHHPLDLEGANSLLAGQHEVDDAEPVAKRLIGVLEDRAGDMREAVVGLGRRALVALPIPWHRAVLVDLHSCRSAGKQRLPASDARQDRRSTHLRWGKPFPIGRRSFGGLAWAVWRGPCRNSPLDRSQYGQASISQVKHNRQRDEQQRRSNPPRDRYFPRRAWRAAGAAR